MAGTTLRVTLVKSAIGYSQRQKDTLRTLGLVRMNQTVERKDHPSTRGMIAKVAHLVRVEEIPANAEVEDHETA